MTRKRRAPPPRPKAESAYSKKLRDPRWQKKRLQVLERDEWHCQLCYASEDTLHVHHKWYSGEPWEVPAGALFAVCESCHEEDFRERPTAEARLLRALKASGFTHTLLDSISAGFEALASRDAEYAGSAGVPLMRLDFLAGGIRDVLSDEGLYVDFTEDHVTRTVEKTRAERAANA